MIEETQELHLPTDERVSAIALLALTPGWFTGEGSLKKCKHTCFKIFKLRKITIFQKTKKELFF